MLKRSIEVVGNILVLWALLLLWYYRSLTGAIWAPLILGLCYLFVCISSRKGYYLYPAGFLLSGSYLFTLTLVGSYNTHALLALPLIFVLYGLSYYLRNAASFAKPLNVVGHVDVLALTVTLLLHQEAITSHLPVIIAMAIYAGGYLFLTLLRRDRGYLFGACIFFSLIFYFVLPGIPQVPAELQPAYYVVISPILMLVGYLFQRRTNVSSAKPIYTAAVAIALIMSVVGLILGDVHALRVVLLISCIVYGLAIILLKRDEYIYLITLSLGFLAYNFMQISGDKFSRQLVDFFLYGLILTGLVFFFLFIRRTLRYGRPTSLIIAKGWKGITLFSLPIILLVFIAVVVYANKATENPKFCGSCHVMKAQYESWERSSHRSLGCVPCHRIPGFKGFVEEKITGVMEMAKYVTGMYETKSHAQVDDRACLQPGCHVKEKLYKEITYRPSGPNHEGVKYDHQAHIAAEARGIGLRCASCHSHIVEGEHFTVTKTVCFQCHLSGRDEGGVAVGTCLTCHDLPRQDIEYAYISYNHVDFLEGKAKVKCTYCHSEVTHGGGEIREGICKSCHTAREYDKGAFETIHQTHVSSHKVECFNCHVEIEHGIKRQGTQPAAGCGDCHSHQHTSAEMIYAGKGGIGVEDTADPMFAADVDCGACHRFGEVKADGKQMVAKSQACDDCHGEDGGYSILVPEWQGETRAALARVESLLERAKSELHGAADQAGYEEALGAYQRAKRNYDLVASDGSFGVHNISYVGKLLHKAEEDARRCLKLLKRQAS